MEPIIAHFQEHWTQYAVGAVLAIPLLYLTRKWSLPLIQWTFELCVYAALMHVVVHYVIVVAEWFNYESQMKMLKDQREYAGWETPLLYFWQRAEYKPFWVFWLEVFFVCVAVYLMYRLRPMKTQRPGPKREALRKGHAPQVRPRGHR